MYANGQAYFHRSQSFAISREQLNEWNGPQKRWKLSALSFGRVFCCCCSKSIFSSFLAQTRKVARRTIDMVLMVEDRSNAAQIIHCLSNIICQLLIHSIYVLLFVEHHNKVFITFFSSSFLFFICSWRWCCWCVPSKLLAMIIITVMKSESWNYSLLL